MDKKDGTLLFVHGWAADNSVWDDNLEAIAKDKTFHNLNLPGHGGSSIWDEPTLKPAVMEIGKLLTGLEEQSAIGIGWSLGAEALIDAAVKDIKKFKALVLVGATPCFVEREGFPWGQPRALVKRMILDMKNGPAEAVKRFYPLNFTVPELGLEAVKRFMERYQYPGPVVCGAQSPGCYPAFRYAEITEALAALYSTDLRGELRKLDTPTLIIHGGSDGVCPVGAGGYLAANIKGARMEVFENAGHAPFITEPQRFNSIVKGFLSSL